MDSPPDYTSSIHLAVPADIAFRTITDLEHTSWNSFTPKMTPDRPPSSRPTPDNPLTIASYPIGTSLTLKVHLLVPFPIVQKERITAWDLPTRQISWSQGVLPRWLLRTDRTQRILVTDTGCEYVTTMVRTIVSIPPCVFFFFFRHERVTVVIRADLMGMTGVRRSEVLLPDQSG